ncbi:MAG TPA: Crp/Fnr family transcriptional regulator [Anaerolineales bacterium]|nr:Crp/Fnr family transcriptional regulator [Anaerolineales bacterium]
MDLLELETNYPVFSSLSPLLKQATFQRLFRVKAQPGQVVFDTNDPCNTFFLLLSGTLRVIQPSLNGRELVLYRLSPGDSCILTVSCLLGAKSYPARGISETELIGYGLSKDGFQDLLTQSEAFRKFVFGFFAEKILNLMQMIETLAWGQLDQRLATLLLKHGDVIPTTHHMLANEVGSVREVVSRVLKDMEQQGLVQLGRRQIVVINRAGLKKIAQPFGDLSH